MLFHLHIDLIKQFPELNFTVVSGNDEKDPNLLKREHKSQVFYTHDKCTICKSRQGRFRCITGGGSEGANEASSATS